MYGIRIDEETREFSVVDTREFGIVTAAALGGAYAVHKGGQIVRREQKPTANLLNKRDARRHHRERLAMIKAGMDPTAMEDYRTKEMHEKYGLQNHKIDAKTDRIDARSRRKANTESYKLDKTRIVEPEKTKRTAIRRK